MGIQVETGQVVPGANSFVSLEAADTYHSDRSNALWIASTDPDKEAALIRATDYIEQMYAPQWTGYLTDQDQPLSWPRTSAYAVGGRARAIAELTVPIEVIRATCELALRTVDGTPLLEDVGRTVVKEKVDVIEVEYDPNSRPQVLYAAAQQLLDPLIGRATGGISHRLVRC